MTVTKRGPHACGSRNLYTQWEISERVSAHVHIPGVHFSSLVYEIDGTSRLAFDCANRFSGTITRYLAYNVAHILAGDLMRVEWKAALAHTCRTFPDAPSNAAAAKITGYSASQYHKRAK